MIFELKTERRALGKWAVVAYFYVFLAARAATDFVAAADAIEFASSVLDTLAAQFRTFVKRAILAGGVHGITLVIVHFAGHAMSASAAIGGERGIGSCVYRRLGRGISNNIRATIAAGEGQCQQGAGNDPKSHRSISCGIG